MAIINITQRFQKVTLPADTDQHELNFQEIGGGFVVIRWLTGTFQISDQTIDSSSGTVNEDNPDAMIDITDFVNHKVKGGAGSETFNVMVLK